MPDIKFSCPSCQQHIAADDGYAGMQVDCPSCQASLVIPQVIPQPVRPQLLRVQTAAAPAPAPVAGPTESSASGCPSCGNAVPRGAVLCINCGYNFTTGKRMVAGQAVALGRPTTPQWETPWYKTVYPYLGLFVALLGIFYLLGREKPAFMLAFIGLAALYGLGVHLAVIVTAFRESVGTGFLTMCIPFYAIYFVFKVNDNDTLKLLYGICVILNLSLRFLIRD